MVTVRQLLVRLSAFDPDAEVLLDVGEGDLTDLVVKNVAGSVCIGSIRVDDEGE